MTPEELTVQQIRICSFTWATLEIPHYMNLLSRTPLIKITLCLFLWKQIFINISVLLNCKISTYVVVTPPTWLKQFPTPATTMAYDICNYLTLLIGPHPPASPPTILALFSVTPHFLVYGKLILKFETYTYSNEVDSRCGLNLQLRKNRKYRLLISCLFRCAKGKQKIQITH